MTGQAKVQDSGCVGLDEGSSFLRAGTASYSPCHMAMIRLPSKAKPVLSTVGPDLLAGRRSRH